MPGYTDCACRDCFEIAIGEPGTALCNACEEAGCEANEGECQAPHAYCCSDSEYSEAGDLCTVCGEPF